VRREVRISDEVRRREGRISQRGGGEEGKDLRL
jgi:hypothetical protein